MAGKKKEQPKPYWLVLSEKEMEIHLSGDLLSNAVFQKIVELMKEKRESEYPRAVHFVVQNGSMMLSVKYAVPSAFYESVRLEKQVQAIDEEVLNNAVGM